MSNFANWVQFEKSEELPSWSKWMRSRLENLQNLPAWIKESSRLSRLEILDRYLDGSIYDVLVKEFDEDTTPNGGTIPLRQRKPSSRWNFANQLSRQIGRKIFAGRHRPTVAHDKPSVVLQVQDIIQQSKLYETMLDATLYGSVGSVCLTFKIVELRKNKPQIVVEAVRSKYCHPVFNIAKQLTRLRIAYPVEAAYFLEQGYALDFEGKKINPKRTYWFIRDIDEQREIHYKPIIETKWKPSDVRSERLVEIADGPLFPIEHKLGFVPAQWIVNLSGGQGTEGACLFLSAMDNVILYDYAMSHLNMGILWSACPHIVIQGSPVNQKDEQGNPLPYSPTRYFQFNSDQTDGEYTVKGGSADLLEPTGRGMEVGLKELCQRLKRDALEQVCASLKEPNKVTTAMSGRGMEVIEAEFLDLMMEVRERYGNGMLELLQKILEACIIKGLELVQGLNLDDVEKLTLAWPPMFDMSPQEFQQFITGLTNAVSVGVMDPEHASELYSAWVDVPIHHSGDGDTVRKPIFKEPPAPQPANQGGSFNASRR